jgi:hypothetical protein
MKLTESSEFVRLNNRLVDGVNDGTISLKAFEAFLDGHKSSTEVAKSKWTVAVDGTIVFSVTTDGASGGQCIKNLQELGFKVSDWAQSMLRSPKFKPSRAGLVIDVVVMRGTDFNDDDRSTKKIRAKAKKSGFLTPNAEVAYLIRKSFSDEDLKAMGLWWIAVMHEPIKDSGGGPSLLGVHRYGDGQWLSSRYGKPGFEWNDDGGFAFSRQQVSSGT